MIPKIFLVVMILLGSHPRTTVETHHFNILHKEKILGQFTVYKSSDVHTTVYQSNTYLETRFPFHVKVSFDKKVTFREGTLCESVLKVYVNDKLKTDSRTSKVRNTYYFYKNDKLKKTFEFNFSLKNRLVFRKHILKKMGVSSILSGLVKVFMKGRTRKGRKINTSTLIVLYRNLKSNLP